MIFGKNRAFLYPTKVLADTNNIQYLFVMSMILEGIEYRLRLYMNIQKEVFL